MTDSAISPRVQEGAAPSVGDPGPLEGVRVVDLSVTLPGPYCTQVLHRLGASVTHLEPPEGDSLRSVAPASHAALAAGKESVMVDLKHAQDRELALDILSTADVVMEGWRPGVADRLGVGYEAVRARNAGVVYCSLSSYGTEGNLANRPGHDINMSAASGALDLLRTDGLPVGDFAGAMTAATRILAELTRVARTGLGRHILVSIAGTLVDWVDAIGGSESADFLQVYEAPHYGVYATSDGARIALGVAPLEQRLWGNLATALGHEEWSDLGYRERLDKRHEITGLLSDAIGRRTLDEISRLLEPVNTCWSVVVPMGGSNGITGGLPRRPGPVPILDEHGSKYR